MNLRSFRRNQCGRLVLNIYRKVWISSKRKKKSILNDKKFFIRDIISFRDNVKEFSKNIEWKWVINEFYGSFDNIICEWNKRDNRRILIDIKKFN